MNDQVWIWAGAAAIVAVLAGWRIARSRRPETGDTPPTPQRPQTAPVAPAAAATPAPEAPSVVKPAGVTPPASREAAASPLQRVVALALGDPAATSDSALDPAATQQLLGASQELAGIGGENRYTPRRPSLLPQLLEAVSDEDASMRALARIIAQDPALTGDLLRTANSALYRSSGSPVESIERAAAMLGTTGLRTLISTALVKPLAAGDSGAAAGRFGELSWEHSIFSASAAEAWAARVQDCDPFTAHLLGLMHGLGDVAVYRVMRDVVARQPIANPSMIIAHALATQGAVTARRIAAGWGLSERTQDALEAQSAAAPAVEVTALARALRFGRHAGAVAQLCRHGKMDEAEAVQALAGAGFSGPQVERIWDRMVRAYVHP